MLCNGFARNRSENSFDPTCEKANFHSVIIVSHKRCIGKNFELLKFQKQFIQKLFLICKKYQFIIQYHGLEKENSNYF